MSDTWTYELLLSRRLSAEQLRLACLIAEERGYSPLTLGGGVARVISLDGMDIREHTRVEDAWAELEAEGGALQLWKGEIDALLAFHPAGSPHVSAGLAPAPDGWSRVVLSVDGSFFRDKAVRTTVAADMLEIFVGLCERLGAAYGLCWEEETAEALSGAAESLVSSLVAGGKPPLLLWMNYFRREHFQWLDEALFSRVGGWVTIYPQGLLVSFFDLPWDVDLGRLREVNQRWSTGDGTMFRE
jgi:hypothetical protein